MDLSFLAAAQAAVGELAPTATELAPLAGGELGEGPVAAAEELDFSLWALFLRATWVVQAVMVLLLVASFWSWAIMLEKSMVLRRVRRQTEDFEELFWSGQPLDQLYDRLETDPNTAVERVFVAGMKEWRRSFRREGGLIPGTTQRIDRAMSVAIARESEMIQRRLSFLASVGSNAPFVGLFGTVWGIKTSFEAIAIAENTNLAVVAPGIAEALLATAPRPARRDSGGDRL